MVVLSPRQRAFVLSYVVVTNADATASARLAGYEDNNNGSIRVAGYRATHNPKILAAIREVVVSRVQHNLPVYINALERVAATPSHKDHVRAIDMLVSRGGMPEITERNVNINVTISKEQKVAEIRELAVELGLDPMKLLGNVAALTPAEFEDVAGE